LVVSGKPTPSWPIRVTANMAIDREAIRDFKLAYMAMFDQIANPDGTNYARLRAYVWSLIEADFSDDDKHRQTQALSALTYTLMVAALACAAVEDLGLQDDDDDPGLVRFDKAAWCLGMTYSIALTHPENVEGEHGLSVLGKDCLRTLFAAHVPAADDTTFWGEFRVLGEALYQRMFTLSMINADDPAPLLYALGVGFGLCPREEVMLRNRLVRSLLARAFALL
jgi:hypothetical protein